MMFCSKCGTQFQESDVICNNCGSSKKANVPTKPNVKPHSVNTVPAVPRYNQPVIIQQRGMSGIAGFFVLLLVIVVILAGLSYFGVWCIGETLGFTDNCLTPICRNNSTLFDDFCSRCRGIVDDVRGIFR
jgi:predicted amidophosphoribosyltransferase